MTSYTPNLKLLKKNPSTDGNDTFNIETMLNDNWDKVDDAFKTVFKPTIEIIEHSQNWTVPTGVKEVLVFLIGGGGGGGGHFNGYAGGGGGGYAATQIIKVTPGDVIPIIIGSGGSGAIVETQTATTNATARGASSFGNMLTCLGGEAGISSTSTSNEGTSGGGSGGAGGGGAYLSRTAGTGGSGKGEDGHGKNAGVGAINQLKHYCGAFCPITQTLYGGGGAGGISPAESSGYFSGGAGGGGNSGINTAMTNGAVSLEANGVDGQLYGAGGGAGAGYKRGSSYPSYGGSGGNGHAGVCIIAY